jgi:hypothetical protein
MFLPSGCPSWSTGGFFYSLAILVKLENSSGVLRGNIAILTKIFYLIF